MVLITVDWQKIEIKNFFRYDIIRLQKMALETVKISVLAYVSYNETKERTFIAEKITSLHDIALAVRKRFGNVEIQEVHYRGKF